MVRTLYKSEVVTSLLNNSASWIGLTDELVDKLQDFHLNFESPKQGTPTGIIELDSNMLIMKNRKILSKLTYVGKVMAKSLPNNMCRRALLNCKNVCNGKDLLTECENWCRDLDIPKVTKESSITYLIPGLFFVWIIISNDTNIRFCVSWIRHITKFETNILCITLTTMTTPYRK